MTQTEMFRKLVRDYVPAAYAPPGTPPAQRSPEHIFASILFALSDRVEKLDQLVNLLAKVISEMAGVENDSAATAGPGPRDQTPFPAGATPAPAVPSATSPAADIVADVQSAPAVNPAPIPTPPKKTNNGAKDSV